MKVTKTKLAVTTALVVGFVASSAMVTYATTTPGTDYGFSRYETVVDVSDAAVLEYGQTEGSGADLYSVKTYTELYKNGVWQESSSNTGSTYAYAETRATNWLGACYSGITTHRADSWNGSYITATSSDQMCSN